MTVQLKPETERLIQEEIRSGHIGSVDELIVFAVHALREKHHAEPAAKSRQKLYDLLTQPPFAGSELHIERQKDYPGPIEL